MSDKLIHQRACPKFDLPQILRRRRLIILSISAVTLVILLILTYSQTRFFGRVFLKSLAPEGFRIEADSFRLIGANRFVGTNLQIFDEKDALIFGAQNVEMRFGIRTWFGNRIVPKEVKIDGAEINIHQSDDDDSIDELLNRFSFKPEAFRRRYKKKHVEITNSQLSFSWKDRPESSLQISDLNYSIKVFGGDVHKISGQLKIVADENAKAEMNFDGYVMMQKSDIGSEKNILTMISSNVEFDFPSATGRLKGLEGDGGFWVLKMGQGEIRDSVILFGEDQIMVKGPIDLSRNEWHLELEAKSISSPLLNLASAFFGLDFGESQLSAKASLDWSFGGSIASMKGKIEGNNLEVIKGNIRTPKTDFLGEYAFQYFHGEDSMLVQQLHISAKNKQKEWLRGLLKSPVFLSWGAEMPGIKEPDFELSIEGIDLRLWGELFGIDLPSGNLTFDSKSTLRQDGRAVESNWKGHWSGLEIMMPSGKKITQLDFEMQTQLERFKRLRVLGLQYDWNEDRNENENENENHDDDRNENHDDHNHMPLLSGEGLLSYDFETKDYTAQIISRGSASRILAETGMDDLKIISGNADMKLRIAKANDRSDIMLNLNFEELEGCYFEWDFIDHRFNADLDFNLSKESFKINTLAFRSQSGLRDSGTIRLRGDYDPKDHIGLIRFESVGVNRHFFGPALDRYLRFEEDDEGQIGIEGEASWARGGEGRVSSKIKIEKLHQENDSEDSKNELEETGIEIHSEAVIDGDSIKIQNGMLQLDSFQEGENVMNFDLELLLDSDLTSSDRANSLRVFAERIDLSDYVDWAKETIIWDRIHPSIAVELDVDELYLKGFGLTNLIGKIAFDRDLKAENGLPQIVGKVEGSLQIPRMNDQTIHQTIGEKDGETISKTMSQKIGETPFVDDEFDEYDHWLKSIFTKLDLPKEMSNEDSQIHMSVDLDGTFAKVTLKMDAEFFDLSASGKLQISSPIKDISLNLPLKLSWKKGGEAERVATIRGSIQCPKIEWETLAVKKFSQWKQRSNNSENAIDENDSHNSENSIYAIDENDSHDSHDSNNSENRRK